MPLDTDIRQPETGQLTEEQQHAAIQAFIAEASAEIEQLTGEIETAKQTLPDEKPNNPLAEPTQEQIDEVIAGAEAITRQAAGDVNETPPLHDEHNLTDEHVEEIHSAIEQLDDPGDPPEQPPDDPGDDDGQNNNGDASSSTDLSFGYNRANVDADAQQNADIYAEKKIKDELETGNFLSRIAKRAFKGNVLRQYYSSKYKLEYEQRVREAGGQIYTPLEQLYGMGGDEAALASQTAMSATLERVMSEDPRMRRIQEHDEEISAETDAQNRLREVIKDLALRYAAGELDDMSVIAERDRLFAEIEGLNDTLFGNGIHFADNMLELARNVRAEIEHGQGLERVEAVLDAINLGGAMAKSGANAQLKQTIFDKLSRRVHTSRIGGTAIATTILLSGAIVFSGTRRAAQSTTAAALRLTGVGAAAAGAISAGNEYGAVRREAAASRAEHALGIDYDSSGNRRRQAMDGINYESQDVNHAIQDMRMYISESGEFNPDAGDQDLLNAQDLLVRIRTLMEQGNTTKIDLLRFNGIAQSASQLMDLMKTMCELEAAIEQRAAQGGDILGGRISEGHQVYMSVAEALEQQTVSTRMNTLSSIGEDVDAKNNAYRRLMARRVSAAFVAGAVAGVAVGTVVQEAVAMASPEVTGVFGTQEPGKANTLLNSIIYDQRNNELAYGPETHLVVGKDSRINLNLPNGLDAHFDKKGTVDIIDTGSGDKVVNNLEFTKNGRLTDESIQRLNGIGVNTSETHTIVGSEPKQASAKEFYKANKDLLVHSNNTLMMNDTIGNPDLNELHFYAAGEDGSWMDKDGNVRIRVDGITDGGSFQGDQSVNAPNAIQDGKLKVFMSPDKAHGMDNFAFTVKEHNGHYQVVIPKDHPAYQLFGKRDGGGGASEGFKGRYLGAAVDRGANARGVHNYAVINSIVGSNNAEFMVGSAHKEFTTSFEFTTLSTTETSGTLPVISVPVYPRRGIGAPRVNREQLRRTPELIGSNNYYGGRPSPERLAEWERDRSPRLRDNPDATLNPAEELTWYREELRGRDGGQYEMELQQQIDTIPELHNLSPKTRAIVTIPVAAASEQDNIYKTLSLYAQQEGVDFETATLLLHVNWMDEAINDPVKKAAIEKTKAEIERARADYPELQIAVVETEWEKAFMDTQRGIIGHVARKMADIAMLSSARAIDIGTIEPNQDILVVRNDADAQGMSRHYLRNMLNNFERNTDTDVFVGGMRWESSQHGKYPGFGVSSNFREVMQALTGRPGSGAQVATIGINHAIRISTLAAVGGLGSHNYTGAGSDGLEVQGRVYAARDKSSRGPGPQGYASGYASGAAGTTTKRPIRYVIGAQIDSAADRVMAAYFGKGNGFVDAWSDFDKGGYKEPDTSDIPDSREDPRTDIESIATRIERDISRMSTEWFGDPARVRTGLAFMFPDKTKDGSKVYDLSWRNGVCTFKFTPKGQKWLKIRLTRDSKGHFDPYGTRAGRALYGKVSASAAKQPKAPVPPMVTARVN